MSEKVVPFVALWSAEYDVAATTRFSYHPTEGFLGVRDKRGILWMNYGDSLGEGAPMFSQVHPIRQKLCMEGPYCQVCGKKMTGKYTPWLVPELSMSEWDTDLSAPTSRPFLTHTPPTCQDCWPIATSLCPHLRANDFIKLLVRDYAVEGVHGDYWRTKDDQQNGYTLRFGNPLFPQIRKKFIAKQLVVRIKRWKVLT